MTSIKKKAKQSSQSRRDIFSNLNMNARTSNDSNIRYGHFTNSCLEIFDKVPVLEPIISSHVQEVFPSTSLDESSIEFDFDRSFYLDMRDTRLMI